MSESLLSKIGNTIAGVAHDAVDAVRHSNPGMTGRQIVRNFDKEIGEVDAALTNIRATKELRVGEKDLAEKDLAKWTDNAIKAVQKGDDDLARQCLSKKKEAEAKVKACDDQIAAITPQLDAAEASLKELVRQRDEAENKTDILQARKEIADAQTKTTELLNGGTSGAAKDSFNELEKAVMKDEARARAVTGRAAEQSGADLDARVRALDNTSIDDELAALKSQHAPA